MPRSIYPTNASDSGTTPLKYAEHSDLQHFSPSSALRRSFQQEMGSRPSSRASTREYTPSRDSKLRNSSSYESMKRSIIHTSSLSTSSPRVVSNSPRPHDRREFSHRRSSNTAASPNTNVNLFKDTLYLSNGLKASENEPQHREELFLEEETREMKRWIKERRVDAIMGGVERSFIDIEEEYKLKQREKRKPYTKWTHEDDMRSGLSMHSKKPKITNPLEYSRLVSSPQLVTELSHAEEGLNASYQYASPDHRTSYRSNNSFRATGGGASRTFRKDENAPLGSRILSDSFVKRAQGGSAADPNPHSTEADTSQQLMIDAEDASHISHQSDHSLNMSSSVLDDFPRLDSPRDQTINISQFPASTHRHSSFKHSESFLPSNINSTRYHLHSISMKDSESSTTRDYNFVPGNFTILTGRNNVGKSRLIAWIRMLSRAFETNNHLCFYKDSSARMPKDEGARKLCRRFEYAFKPNSSGASDPISIVLYQTYNITLLTTGQIEAGILNAGPDTLSDSMKHDIKSLNDAISINFTLLCEALRQEKQSASVQEFSQQFQVHYCDFASLKAPKSLHVFLSQFDFSSTKSFNYMKRQLFKRISSLIQDCRIEERVNEGEIRLLVSERPTSFSLLSESYRKLFELAGFLFKLETTLARRKTQQAQDSTTILLLDHLDSLLDGMTAKRLSTYLQHFAAEQEVQLICAVHNPAFVQNDEHVLCLFAPEAVSLQLSLFSGTLLPYFHKMQYPLWKQVLFLEKLIQFRSMVFVSTVDDLKIVQTLLDRFVPNAHTVRKQTVWIVMSDLLGIDTNQVDYRIDAQILDSLEKLKDFLRELNQILHSHLDVSVETQKDIQTLFLLNGSLLSETRETLLLPWKRSLGTNSVFQFSQRNLQNHIFSLDLVQSILNKRDDAVHSSEKIQEAFRKAYNGGSVAALDAGVYQDIIQLFSEQIPQGFVSQKSFDQYLHEKHLSTDQLKDLFGSSDGSFLINTLRSRVASSKKNQKVMPRVEQFMLHHQLPIHLRSDVGEDLNPHSNLLKYIHVPSILNHLHSSLRLSSRTYLDALHDEKQHLDEDVKIALQKVTKLCSK